jgi:hypothetical protein
MMIDYGYAADLDELQRVLKLMSAAAKKRHEGVDGVGGYDDGIVQLNGMQAKVELHAKTLEDGSEVYDLQFHWDGVTLTR